MSIFDEAKASMKRVEESIHPIMQDAFNRHKDVIIDFQVDEQLQKGKDSKGSIIRPAYARSTIRMKIKKGQPTDKVTWKDSGKLHRTIKVLPRADYVEIITTVPYAKYLIAKYGEDVMGIQDELLKDFLERYVLPEIKTKIDDESSRT